MSSSPTSTAIITVDPDFVDLAREEVTGSVLIAGLDGGVLLLELGGSYWELAEAWRHQPPIFVRHVCPVQERRPLPPGENAVHALRALAEEKFAPLMDPALPFSVQTRILTDTTYAPYDVNKALSTSLEARSGAPLNVPEPQQILSVVIATVEDQITAFLGLSPAAYNLSDWAGGRRRFARREGHISRSEFTLLEALEVFGLELPARGVVLDLGAAPGGWTRILLKKEQYVTAIDPAQLHENLADDPNLRYKQMTAEKYLQEGPDRFDMIVNDMRLDARDSARLMVSYAPYLYRHGRAIMTLKLPLENRRSIIDHSLDILRQAYEIAGARQLFHNRSEITLHLKLPDA